MSEVKQQKTLEELRQILATTHTIAVVGRSGLSDRPSNRIPAYLQSQGYRIIPVNPKLAEALGEKAYPNLREVTTIADAGHYSMVETPVWLAALVDRALFGAAPNRAAHARTGAGGVSFTAQGGLPCTAA